VMLKQSQP